jgi:urease beta subunit
MVLGRVNPEREVTLIDIVGGRGIDGFQGGHRSWDS